jgi:hypothetical protein
MNKEEFRKKINDSDMTLLTDFDKYYESIKEQLDNCRDVEFIPGKITVRPFSKTPGFIKFI